MTYTTKIQPTHRQRLAGGVGPARWTSCPGLNLVMTCPP
jgi:hypothetical protein